MEWTTTCTRDHLTSTWLFLPNISDDVKPYNNIGKILVLNEWLLILGRTEVWLKNYGFNTIKARFLRLRIKFVAPIARGTKCLWYLIFSQIIPELLEKRAKLMIWRLKHGWDSSSGPKRSLKENKVWEACSSSSKNNDSRSSFRDHIVFLERFV